jgi:hypothetical protein
MAKLSDRIRSMIARQVQDRGIVVCVREFDRLLMGGV